MDFALTRQQEMLRDMVHQFAESELAPRALELDESREFPFDILKRIAEMGLVGIITPKAYGGTDMGHVAKMIAVEEISRAYPSLAFSLEAIQGGIYTLQTYGTEEQKREYLPPLCRGEKTSCTPATEPGGGSDPSTIQTTAELIGDEFVVNGRKVFICFGIADLACVLAKANGKFNIILVEKGTPGFEVTRREDYPGLRSLSFNELAFTSCRVPKANLIGQEGRGLAAALAVISIVARPTTAGVGLGVARGCYEAALRFAKERILYGKPIGDLQAIQFALVDMNVEIEAAKWLAYYSACQIDQGEDVKQIGADTSRAKLIGSDVACRVALSAIQMMGGYGLIPEYHIVRRFKDALPLLAGSGTQEIMKVIIGRSLMP
jgi:alkylation response protein AidB-like acyl-CoA dehydrogenase